MTVELRHQRHLEPHQQEILREREEIRDDTATSSGPEMGGCKGRQGEVALSLPNVVSSQAGAALAAAEIVI